MRVEIESETEGGTERWLRIRLDGRVVEVADIIDRWHGADHCYVKVNSPDGVVYILRHDDARAEWELILYRHPAAPETPSGANGIGTKH